MSAFKNVSALLLLAAVGVALPHGGHMGGPMGGPMGGHMGGHMGGPMGGPMGPPSMGGRPMGPPPPMGGPRPSMGGPFSSPNGNGRPCPQPQPQPTCKNTDPEANKKLVLEFYQVAFGDHDASNLEKYLSQNYIEHNPNEPDGIDGIRGLIEGPLASTPKQKVDVKLALAEKDLVALRVRLDFLGTEYATGDFFRIGCDGKIAEHWDSLQRTDDIPANSPNPHPFF